ncbi:hypothetical protein J437_LFUL015606 [Ladona fulva]|uniref:Uncharacterized protein n=1 Tax=Ladona fulva TaxID=123851 RepID=A0A8K0KP08_LADFU|nr:hypothetical protein J437_LFUL015606 [Ladona fulva]
MAPADFFLFPRIKTVLKGSRFESIEAIQDAVTKAFGEIPVAAFQDAYRAWQSRWGKCVVGRHLKEKLGIQLRLRIEVRCLAVEAQRMRFIDFYIVMWNRLHKSSRRLVKCDTELVVTYNWDTDKAANKDPRLDSSLELNF